MRQLAFVITIAVVLAVLGLGTDAVAVAGEGAIELVLEASPSDGRSVDRVTLEETVTVLEQRLVVLGAEGVVVRVRDDGRIVVRANGLADAEGAIDAMLGSALLEIIDPEGQLLPEGTIVRTTLGDPDAASDSGAATRGVPALATPAGPTYTTIISSADLADVFVTTDNTGVTLVVGFRLNGEGARKFQEFTSANIGQPMSIVVDKRVISSPIVQAAISDQGIITGVPQEEVTVLAAQLRSSPLPVPLVVVERRVTVS
jgi:preprotein translocase subunit SecD